MYTQKTIIHVRFATVYHIYFILSSDTAKTCLNTVLNRFFDICSSESRASTVNTVLIRQK